MRIKSNGSISIGASIKTAPLLFQGLAASIATPAAAFTISTQQRDKIASEFLRDIVSNLDVRFKRGKKGKECERYFLEIIASVIDAYGVSAFQDQYGEILVEFSILLSSIRGDKKLTKNTLERVINNIIETQPRVIQR